VTLRTAVVSAQHRHRGGFASLCGSPQLRRATAWLACMALFGCTSAAARNAADVARSQNDYDFHEAKYEDVCRVAAPPAFCADWKKTLDTWLTDLHRKSFIDWTLPKPVQPRTGPTPLHDAALVADEKAATKVAKTVLP
jgi:hypothetical protein